MCGPLAILASAGSTMIQMSAQQKQAEATAKNERRVAMQQKIDREMGKVQALQRQNQRVEEYISAEKSNMAVLFKLICKLGLELCKQVYQNSEQQTL